MRPAGARVRAVFDDAADLPEDERDAFVERACGGDDALAAEVRRLLAHVGAQEPSVVAAGEAAAPARVGRFELRDKLGEGGMGVVYRAHDRTLDREVAVKLVNAAGGADGRARLLREAQAMARVAHPNVVPIFEVGVEQEQVFLAMELVRGTTLTAWLRAAPRGWRDTLRVVIDAGRGLAAAHRAGVLHRDVKPDNTLIGDDGRARIVDFGLARAHDGDEETAEEDVERPVGPGALTRAGAVVGTPGFMAPEQLDGAVTTFSDQWSLAATAYYALFGALPWSAPDLRGLRVAMLTTPPRVPAASDVPAEVVAAIQRGLSAYPEDRFASVTALVDALESALAAGDDERHHFRRQRRGLAVGIALASVASFVVNAVRTGGRFDMPVLGLMIQTAIGTLIVLAAAFGFRRAVLRTAYDRRLVALLVTGLAAVTVHRAVQLGEVPVRVVRGDAVLIMALLVFATFALERWLVWPAVVMAAQLALSLAVPATTVATFGPALMATVVAGIWIWREPPARRKGGESRWLQDSS